jgi:hypothetical protein
MNSLTVTFIAVDQGFQANATCKTVDYFAGAAGGASSGIARTVRTIFGIIGVVHFRNISASQRNRSWTTGLSP